MKTHCGQRNGFTLLEIIVTLVLVSILGTMVVTFLRGTVVSSSDPMFMVQDLSIARQLMEKYSAVYSSYLQQEIDWDTLESRFNTLKDELSGTEVQDVSDPDVYGTLSVLKVTIDVGEQHVSALFFK